MQTQTQPDPRTTQPPDPSPQAPGFGAAFEQAVNLMTVDNRLRAWDSARIAWLNRCRSENTRSSYETGLNQFYMFVGVNPWLIVDQHRDAYSLSLETGLLLSAADLPAGVDPQPRPFSINPWQVASHHINQFIIWLGHLGKSDATIGQRLAACSSFYQHVINDVRISNDGFEQTLFIDAGGRTRANPFKTININRPEVKQFGKARAIPVRHVAAMMTSINTATVGGARNFAFLETLIQTGWRSTEVRQIVWGDLKPNPRHRGEYIVAWRGKGDKSQIEAFPRKAYDAIEHYLKLAGRWPVVEHDRPLFDRLQDGHQRLGIQATSDYISSSQANSILRRCLRRGLVKKLGYTPAEADAEAKLYHIHCIRHSHAGRYLEEYGDDLYGLQKRLHHSNPNTTLIYANSDAIKKVAPAQQLDFGY